jgi:hypothetical protein
MGPAAQERENNEVFLCQPYEGPVRLISRIEAGSTPHNNQVNIILQTDPEDSSGSRILVQAQVYLSKQALAQLRNGKAIEFWATMDDPSKARWRLEK